jgi:hypothetical protein
MHYAAGYSESRQLTSLIEQLRERLGADPLPNPRMVEQLEEVLSRLVMRNQRLRVLQRLARTSGSREHMEALRDDLERLDTELLEGLPVLLERLHGRH